MVASSSCAAMGSTSFILPLVCAPSSCDMRLERNLVPEQINAGLRNKSFGSGLEFVWSNDKSSSYGVRESPSKIKIFQNFKETKVIRPSFSAEGIFGGTLLAVRSASFVIFYDWEGRVIRKIDVVPKAVWARCLSSHFVFMYVQALNLLSALNCTDLLE